VSVSSSTVRSLDEVKAPRTWSGGTDACGEVGPRYVMVCGELSGLPPPANDPGSECVLLLVPRAPIRC
jgi:hypothetical protein